MNPKDELERGVGRTRNEDYTWQSSGHRYCGRVEFANDKLATQIVNAANHLAITASRMQKVGISYDLVNTVELRDEMTELRKNYATIMADIRKLAKGQTIDEK